MVSFPNKETYDFDDLLEVMKILRGDNGCPWDKEQTSKSIKNNFLEEVYEVIEAIDDEDDEEMKEELGDVLLQVVFHSEMARQDGRFSIEDVTSGIVKKLIHRHPHIFGEIEAENSKEVLVNWEKIKREEKGIGSHSESIAKVPKSMPALLRAFKIQQRAKKAGFDWKDISGAIEKLEEEQNELLEEIKKDDKSGIEEELGDLLFSVVNVSRFLKVDPEISLNKTCDKFIKRFSYVEKIVNTRYNKQLEVLSLEELDEIWEESKNADIKI